MLNKVILMGRLTRDPELKYTPSNVAVCSFTIAVDRRHVKPGEQRQADFINIVTWRNTAEFVSGHFSKGQMINVVGSLQTRQRETPDGSKRYATEVIVDEANFCGDKKNKDPLDDVVNAIGGLQYPPQGFVPADDTDSDFPF